MDRLLLFEYDILCKENNGRTFLGKEDGGEYLTDADITYKEDAFEEADSVFKIVPYANMSVASASACHTLTLSVPWDLDLKCPIKGPKRQIQIQPPPQSP